MILLKAHHLHKYFEDRDLFTIPSLEIQQGDRLGIVGANGSGKTTLLRLLAGELQPDGGSIQRHCEIAFIRQLETAHGPADAALLGAFSVFDQAESSTRSGGEETRMKIAQALSDNPPLLLADEPTANLDQQGQALLRKKLDSVESLVIVSHDRALLDNQCTAILELREGTAYLYPGNYSAYRQQRAAEQARAVIEYEAYAQEKARLEQVAQDKRQKANAMVKGPKNISNSEAKMRAWMMHRKPDVKQKSMAQAAKSVEKRLDRLEVKEKPRSALTLNLNFQLTDPPQGRYVARAQKLHFAYGDRPLFRNASFELPNRAKIALLGKNGAGKTTLMQLLHQGHPAIWTAPKLRFGYFRQNMSSIDLHKTVLENMLRDAVQSEGVARSLLARLLFRKEEVFKPAGVLSGGERVKLSLAMLLTSPCNMLLLDEPTNYLDLPSLEAVQALLQEYEGTVLFVSHDQAFSQAIATDALEIQDETLTWHPGGLPQENAPSQESGRLLLEHRKALLVSQFGDPNVDRDELTAELAQINAQLKAFPTKKRPR